MNIFLDTDTHPLDYRPNVGIVLLNTSNHIFLGRRIFFSTPASKAKSKSDEHYGWQLPQGGIDTHENAHTAVYRELYEELGLNNAEILRVSSVWYAYDFPSTLNGEPFQNKVWNGTFRGQIQKWFLMRTDQTDDSINLKTDTPEFCDYTWATADDVMAHAISFKYDVYQAVLTEFELLKP